MKTGMRKTWQGYEIYYINESGQKLYIRSVRNGKINASLDYTHARGFSEATAKRYIKGIEDGTLA